MLEAKTKLSKLIWRRRRKEFACLEMPMSYKDIRALEVMEFLHSDPFDRVLMAQAANRKLSLITMDKDILKTAERLMQSEIEVTFRS